MGFSLDVNRVAFTVFGVDIYWYGVCIGLGMLLALVYAFSQSRRFGVDADRMIDVVMGGLVMAIICGRLYFVLTSDIPYNTFFEVIDIRAGGIGIYGGIIGAFIGAAIMCKIRKVPMLPLFDLAGQGFLIGQALGRWGNFFNQEAFGTNTTMPWGMRSQGTVGYLTWMQDKLAAQGIQVNPQMPVHPTFLYESLWCTLGFVLLFLYRKKRRFNGEMFLFYVMWYGAGRFVIEGLRTDSLMVGPLRVSQVVAAVSFAGALVLWILGRKKYRGVPLHVPAIAPHTAQVKLEGEDGPTVVMISWPAGKKEPSKAEKQVLAREVLAAQQAGIAPGKQALVPGGDAVLEKPLDAAPPAKEKGASPEGKAQNDEGTETRDNPQ